MFDQSPSVPADSFFVSKKHIQKGKLNVPSKCALALSMEEVGFEEIWVNRCVSTFSYENNKYLFFHSSDTCASILCFDLMGEIKSPFLAKGVLMMVEKIPSTKILEEMYIKLRESGKIS